MPRTAFGPLDAKSWPRFFDQLAEGRVLRPRWGRHPRLFIWGPLEARLQHADRIILGGLNEGTWPAEAGIDPWLNRPMRAALGLDPPERRIGLAAHDFVEGVSAKEAVLTRAAKVEGTPTVASRWWLRLASVLTGLGHENAARAALGGLGARSRQAGYEDRSGSSTACAAARCAARPFLRH